MAVVLISVVFYIVILPFPNVLYILVIPCTMTEKIVSHDTQRTKVKVMTCIPVCHATSVSRFIIYFVIAHSKSRNVVMIKSVLFELNVRLKQRCCLPWELYIQCSREYKSL